MPLDAETSGRLVGARGIPPVYRNARLNECPQVIRSEIDRWIERPSKGLYLWEESDNGKSKLACAIALKFLQRGMDSLFSVSAVLWATLLDIRQGRIRKAFVFDGLKVPDLLILDDVSMGFWCFPLTADLREVLRDRTAAGKITIATSSISAADFAEYCDSEVGKIFSTFTCIQFPPGFRPGIVDAIEMKQELLASYRNMERLGLIKSDPVGLARRLEKLSEEVKKGKEIA